MEISNEIKAKVFAQYFAQEVLTGETIRGLKPVSEYTLMCVQEGAFRSSKLVLKPLSAISETDAIELVKLFNPDATDIYLSNGVAYWEYEWLGETMESNTDFGNIKDICFPPCIYQFLQSRGYDLPQYLLNGKTLHEAGLCIYP